MAAKPSLPVCDVAILDRLIQPERGGLSAAARNLLKIDFEPTDHERMHELAEKAQEGTLTPAERAERYEYERAGHVLALLHSKARRSLKPRNADG